MGQTQSQKRTPIKVEKLDTPRPRRAIPVSKTKTSSSQTNRPLYDDDYIAVVNNTNHGHCSTGHHGHHGHHGHDSSSSHHHDSGCDSGGGGGGGGD